MSSAKKSPLGLDSERATVGQARKPVESNLPLRTLTQMGRGKAAAVVYAREDGLCSSTLTIGHFGIPGHIVRLGIIPGGWGAYCLGCRESVEADTQGEVRRWAELHIGVYRPMRPN